LAFHIAMGGVYIAIIGVWYAGWARLSIAMCAAALTVCLAFLAGCGMILLTAWRSSGRHDSFVRWFRHQLEHWRVGSADGAAPPPAQELDLKATDVGIVAGMGDEPASQPGLRAADGEPERPQARVDSLHGRSLFGERLDGKRAHECVQHRPVARRQAFSEGQALFE
jgi:hypothetical protein